MDETTVGVIGVGYWGQKHVEELVASGAKVIAVDADAAARERASKRFGVATAASPAEVMDDPRVTAITVCAPNRLHFDIARDALLHDKHVFVEKPLALSSRDAQRLVDLARERRLTLAVGHVFRFNNAVRHAKQMMDFGEFGRTVLVKLTWANTEPLFADRDIVMDLGPHAFDVLHYLYGKYPDTVGAVGTAVRRAHGAEVAFVQGRIQQTLYQFELSWVTPRKARRLEIIGTKKSLVADLTNQKVEVFDGSGWRDANVIPNNTIRAELESFLAVIHNRNAHLADGSIAVGNLEMLELAQDALSHPGETPVKLAAAPAVARLEG